MLLVRSSIAYVISSDTPITLCKELPSSFINSRPVQQSTHPVSASLLHCFSSFFSSHQSSASRKATYFPTARRIPIFLLSATPRLRSLRSSITLPLSTYFPAISAVWSVEQSSIMKSSNGTFWHNTDSIALAIYFCALYAGMITDTTI